MVKFGILVLFLVISAIFAAPSDETTTTPPEDEGTSFPTCKRTDPDRDSCFKNVTMSFKGKIANGIKDFGIPPIDPMTLPSVKLEQNSDEITFKSVLTDVKIQGLSDFDLVDIKTDFDKLSADSLIRFPNLLLNCDFMIMGKYQMLPIEGSGKFFVNFTNMDISLHKKGALVYKNDEAFLMIHETKVDFEVENSDYEFTDFISAGMDKALIAEHIMAYHADDMFKEMKPSFKTLLSMIFDDISSKLFQKIPFETLFPQ